MIRRDPPPSRRAGPAMAGLAAVLVLAGCFPTVRTPRIDPGYHVDAGVTWLGDQRRDERPQGPDYIGYVAPSWGVSERVELGVPIGFYLEEGFESLGDSAFYEFGSDQAHLVVWPYVKLGLLDPEGPHDLALSAQAAAVLPANVGLHYGIERDGWEPYAGVTFIFSGGPAGDDPAVTRYQQEEQTLTLFSAGAAWSGRGEPTVEIGVLRNRFLDRVRSGGDDRGRIVRTAWDLAVAVRFRLFGRSRRR